MNAGKIDLIVGSYSNLLSPLLLVTTVSTTNIQPGYSGVMWLAFLIVGGIVAYIIMRRREELL